MTGKAILAVGAAGRFAGLAVAALNQRDARVRGLVRNAEQGNEAQRLGAAEVIIGDPRDARSVDAALAGIDGGGRGSRPSFVLLPRPAYAALLCKERAFSERPANARALTSAKEIT
jgi:NAD(P)H-binding